MTISSVMGDEGIVRQTKDTKEQHNIGLVEEKIELWKSSNDLANVTQRYIETPREFIERLIDEEIITRENVVNETTIKIGSYEVNLENEDTYVNPYISEYINEIPIPKGFEAVDKSIGENEGFIIKNTADGNEFVWVPVDTFSNFAVLQSGSTSNYRGQLWATLTGNSFGTKNTTYNANNGLREPAVVTGNITGTGQSYDGKDGNKNAIWDSSKYTSGLLEQFQKEYNGMVKSVETYGGFYVGRYETSWDGSKVASVQGATKTKQDGTNEVFTAATDLGTGWTTEKTGADVNKATWYGLYKYQKELYNKDTDSVVSGMIYGAQWDAIMNWMKDIPNPNSTKENEADRIYIKDSTGMGVYSGDGGLLVTGQHKVNNIYDLAGNYFEWTQEAGSIGHRVLRGGGFSHYGSSHPASNRSNYFTTLADYDCSSRLQLYIK